MKPFIYHRAATVAQAAAASAEPGVRLLAGGTNLIDLMKVGAEAPIKVIDIGRLPLNDIRNLPDGGLRIGALATSTEIASDQRVRHRYPVLARALLSGASAQLRNKASAGGNLMQRTRCPYFYDAAQACNKRAPGSGCSAIGGFNRAHAVLGASGACIAVNPSDMAVALMALEAVVEVTNGKGAVRRIAVGDFHLLPGETPQIETALAPGEMVTAIDLPPAPDGPQHWRKVRERASYAGALVSLARAGSCYALGGVALKPWRCLAFEAALAGGASVEDAIEAELSAAVALPGNGFKIELARRLLAEAAGVG